jgi:hypothetical protein
MLFPLLEAAHIPRTNISIRVLCIYFSLNIKWLSTIYESKPFFRILQANNKRVTGFSLEASGPPFLAAIPSQSLRAAANMIPEIEQITSDNNDNHMI